MTRSHARWTKKKGLLSELILSMRLQGACLTHFRCSRSIHTMDKLITNHAYLFIKQGLGEIQRGNTVLTSFNLLSVIKRNTAARLQKCCQIVPFSWFRPLLWGPFLPSSGILSFSPFRCSLATCDVGQAPSQPICQFSHLCSGFTTLWLLGFLRGVGRCQLFGGCSRA